MTKLLAFAASYRADSLNRKLLTIAAAQAEAEGAQVTILDYAALDAPIYRGETGVTALPASVETLSRAIAAHDGILLASPEYNWSIPGGLKNLIDWLSVDPRTPLNSKTVLLLCATTSHRGGISGLQHLRVTLEQLGCWCYPQLLGIGRAQDELQEGRLARDSVQQHLNYCVSDFIRAAKALSDA